MNGSRTPKVSIGLPVYNGETQLANSLDSLLGQTLEDFELIISDNHSTDATEAICRDYAAGDARIRYHRSERNRGAAWNFNRVLELSRGGYFKWASSNDVHAPEYVARCVEVLDRRPEVVLCYPKTRLIDDDGAPLRDGEDNLDLPWPQASRRFKEFLRRVRLSNPIFGVIRSDVLRRTHGLKSYPGSDVVLMGELTMYGAFHEVPEILFFRRLERRNIVREKSLESWQEFFDPVTKGRVFMRTWRHQFEYLRALRRSPLPLPEKIRIFILIGRILFNQRAALARELAGAARHVARRGPVPKA